MASLSVFRDNAQTKKLVRNGLEIEKMTKRGMQCLGTNKNRNIKYMISKTCQLFNEKLA